MNAKYVFTKVTNYRHVKREIAEVVKTSVEKRKKNGKKEQARVRTIQIRQLEGWKEERLRERERQDAREGEPKGVEMSNEAEYFYGYYLQAAASIRRDGCKAGKHKFQDYFFIQTPHTPHFSSCVNKLKNEKKSKNVKVFQKLMGMKIPLMISLP